MRSMNRSRQPTPTTEILGLVLLTAGWLSLVGTTGCSQQVPVSASSGTAKSSQLPFERVSDSGGISPTAGFTFDEIPAGTKFTIRLQAALSSAESQVGQSFDGVVDEPVIIAGKTVVPRGSTVTGSVVAARAYQSLQQPGYLRVALESILVNGKAFPLRTSTVFAKGASYGKREAPSMTRSAADPAQNSANATPLPLGPRLGDVRFSTGHRLTFRLAHPLHVES